MALELHQLGLSGSFAPSADTYEGAHFPLQGSGAGMPPPTLVDVGKHIRAGKLSAKGMLIERLEASIQRQENFARDSLNGMEAALFVLFVGRFERLKGTDTFMAAAEWACATGNVLLLAGEHSHDTQGSAHLDEVFKRFVGPGSPGSCAGRVVVVQDRAAQKQLLPLMRAAADIAIVPSVMEAFGFVSIEALAHSAAVVAANVGGLPDTVMPMLPAARVTGIGGASESRAVQQHTPLLGSLSPGALWTGELFSRSATDPDASVADFLKALRRATSRLEQMHEYDRLVHLAVLQRVAHSYSWAYSGGATVLKRWESANRIASKTAAIEAANSLLR